MSIFNTLAQLAHSPFYFRWLEEQAKSKRGRGWLRETTSVKCNEEMAIQTAFVLARHILFSGAVFIVYKLVMLTS